MAKIRYLVNNNPYQSMLSAIKSENILYAKFIRQFKELWGRLSTGYYSDVGWSDAVAKRVVNGVEVFGTNRAILFGDSSVDFKYTKKFCKITGADYSGMLADLDEVEYFYVDLKGAYQSLDFSNLATVKNAITNIKEILNTYQIDSIKVSFVVDTEIDPNATSGMSLLQIRGLNFPIDHNSGNSYIQDVAGLTPIITYFGLPTYTSSIIDIKNEIGETVGTKTIYETVAAKEIIINNSKLNLLLGVFCKCTTLFDSCFNSISVNDIYLGSRIVSVESVWGEEEPLTYHQNIYTMTFSFDSVVEYETIDEIVLPNIVNKINYAYLTSDLFLSAFANKFDAVKAYYLANREIIGYGNQFQYGLRDEPYKDFFVYTVIISQLGVFSDVKDIFYSPYNGDELSDISQTYIRYNKIISISNKEFSDLIIVSIHFGYVNKKRGGWFGGSFFGKMLELIFVAVVIFAGVFFSVLFNNPIPLIIAMSILAVSAKYGGMSSSGASLALGGITILGIVAIAQGGYDISNALEYEAVTAAVAEAVAYEMSEEATVRIIEQIAISDILSEITLSQAAQLLASTYSAFNLLSPQSVPPPSEANMEDRVTAAKVYNANSAYDFYDNVYNIYNTY